MNAVALLALFAVLFVGPHLVISSNAIRPKLIGIIGEQPYRGAYSLIALATLIPFVIIFARNKHAGAMLWDLRGVEVIRGLTWLMMIAALILLAGSFVTPNPGAIGATANNAPRGILKVTRHPALMAFILFGFAHMLMNGWAGDLVFFGSFVALGILGGWHQDRRKLRELGEPYRQMMAATSFFPGAAIVRGRQHWAGTDIPWIAAGLGVAAVVILVVIHPYVFGGYPLG
ncbi:MAG: NnrU family protein [Candidatus Binataceae bacterium]